MIIRSIPNLVSVDEITMSILKNRILHNLLLFAFIVLSAAVFKVAAQKVETNEGHQLEITLKSDKEMIMLKEPTFFSFEIKNYSSQKLCVGEGGDYRNNIGRPDSYKVTVTGDVGKSVPQPEVKFWGGGLSGCSPIPANGSRIVKLFLPHWATFESTGSYIINVKKSLSIHNYSTKSSSTVKTDVNTNIKVVPYDEIKMGEVIDTLGSIMLNIENTESGNSAQALAYIEDKRAIKYFAQALEKFGKSEFMTDEYFRVSQSAAALSYFNEDSALAALETAVNSPIDEIRLDIASAFDRSEHPKALEFLLKMQNDSYWFVRLRVAQGLSKVKSDETLTLLHKMLKDENEDVRKAAQVSLNTRGQK